jgi:hypothetical protein
VHVQRITVENYSKLGFSMKLQYRKKFIADIKRPKNNSLEYRRPGSGYVMYIKWVVNSASDFLAKSFLLLLLFEDYLKKN